MTSKDSLRILSFILWIGLIVSDVSDLIEAYQVLGNSMFTMYNYIFTIVLVLIMIGMCISLFTYKYKVFISLFGAFVLVDAGFAFTDFAVATSNGLFGGIQTMGDIKLTLYYVFSFYVNTFVMLVYAVIFTTALILSFIGHRKRYKFANFSIDLGYIIAVVRVILVIFSFITSTGGFEFMNILFDLLSAVFFSIIYISVPRDLFYIFD